MALHVAVVGAGINGVTCAFQLKQKYPALKLSIIAGSFSPNNTSDVAAGYWRPPMGTPQMQEKYLRWSVSTLKFIIQNVKCNKDANKMGLTTCHGYLLYRSDNTKIPYWSSFVPNFRVLNEKDLERFPMYIKRGLAYTTGVTEGSRYIDYYMIKLEESGVRIMKKQLTHISELYSDYDVIINCSGVGAKDLIGDEKVYPIKGQIVRVSAPWIKEFIAMTELDSEGRTPYIYPNQTNIILGGVKRDNDYSKESSTEDTNWILNKAKDFYPSLEHASIVDVSVGFRPARDEIRVETENLQDEHSRAKVIIHNYGHGGSGLTFYWGCGEEVLTLFEEFIRDSDFFKFKGKL